MPSEQSCSGFACCKSVVTLAWTIIVFLQVTTRWAGEQVERIYLVAIREPDDIAEFSLNLDDVFILDRQTRDIKRGKIIWNKNITADTDPTTLTLRIR